jgi:membrane associated rhomboid family serine protease
VQYPPPIVAQNKQDKENPEGRSWNGEEIQRNGIFGLLLAFGVMWPENRIFLTFLPVPIKAKWFVLINGAAELMFGVTKSMPGIAHFAHLGGMIFGAGLLYQWGWRPGMTWKK